MADRAASDDNHEADRAPSLLEDLLTFGPRLASRTIAQIQFSQSLLNMLPCARRTAAESDGDDVAPRAAPESVDVLSVLADSREEDGKAGHDRTTPPAAAGTVNTRPAESSAGDGATAPPAEKLAIPEYDSLAASQVVPRLTTLSAAELQAIGAYESAHRGRRTILNRVTQLLGGSS